MNSQIITLTPTIPAEASTITIDFISLTSRTEFIVVYGPGNISRNQMPEKGAHEISDRFKNHTNPSLLLQHQTKS